MNQKEKRKAYREANKEKIKEYKAKYRQENKEKIKEYNTKYRQENKDWVKETAAKYREKNKDVANEYAAKYRENNKETIREYARVYNYNRRHNDNNFRLRKNISRLILLGIRNRGYTKKSKTFDILGCTFDVFKEHIESLWEPWMTWENYGLFEKGKYNVGWDIDHIIPISSGVTEEEILCLNHYTNLKPLCSNINRYEKRNKVE